MDAKYEILIFILFLKISVNIKTIGGGAGMADVRRVTKVFGPVNKKK